ncbi:cytochrome p450 monooxygenase [Moniliophthora roreri MCA 2997]|uniref:Cytochrome p450 monooxygenase n=1 Tax=Moniliophthora roreri (strain MCA 2997) TaxID=1381753 RepID=V2YZT0_MONRO|nr:cytochrome p450 monooxygenase [Moniliophthora roreri MCA 2997]
MGTSQLPAAESVWNAALYAILLALAVTVWLSRTYSDRPIGVRARTDLPGPRVIPFLGNLLLVYPHRKRMLMLMDELQETYGELFTFTMPGWGRNIVVNRPEWLEHIRKRDTQLYGKGPVELAIFGEFPGERSAFGSEGNDWKLSRRIIQPIFTTKTFDEHVSQAMNGAMPLTVSLVESLAAHNATFDFNKLSGRLALMIFCKMALNNDLDLLSKTPEYLVARNPLMDAVYTMNSISSSRLYNPFWRVTEKFDGTHTRFRTARSEISKIIDEIVQERRKLHSSGALECGKDFLSALLDNPSLEDDQKLLRDTLWLERMRNECRSHEDVHLIQYKDLSKYPIHQAVFYETLRLWPGVPKNARRALADDVLPAIPDQGFQEVMVAKGDYVLWSDFAMMRNEKVWGADAKEFNPGRHLNPEGQFVKPPYPKFHAFGMGPRLCPGAQLSAYEFVAIWVALLPRFDFIPVENIERKPMDAFTMSMEGEFLVRAFKRME